MDLDFYDALLMSYTLHKLYELVEGIIREVNLGEYAHSTQKMRLGQAKTLEQAFDR